MKYDIVVIGAGVCGLASALFCAQKFPQKNVLIIEKESAPGIAQSGRNSGVLHAGHLYRPGSLMAQLCVEGNKMLKEFAKKNNVPFKETGKLTVATNDEEVKILNRLLDNAQKNGVRAEIVDSVTIVSMESNVCGVAALYTPETAIADLTAYVKALEAQCTTNGVTIQVNCSVEHITHDSQFEIITSTGNFTCDILINAAGVYADTIGCMLNSDFPYRIQPMRGEYMYFSHTQRADLTMQGMNIYPTPKLLPGVVDQNGNPQYTVGVHLTPQFKEGEQLNDLILVGPLPTPTQSRENKLTNTLPATAFLERITPFFPHITESDLSCAFVGLQTKIKDYDDFVIQKDTQIPSLIHVLAPSPGLTASLAIGKYVSSLL